MTQGASFVDTETPPVGIQHWKRLVNIDIEDPEQYLNTAYKLPGIWVE